MDQLPAASVEFPVPWLSRGNLPGDEVHAPARGAPACTRGRAPAPVRQRHSPGRTPSNRPPGRAISAARSRGKREAGGVDGIRSVAAEGVPRRADSYVQALWLTVCGLLAWLVWLVWLVWQLRHLSTDEAAEVVRVCAGTGRPGTDHFASVGRSPVSRPRPASAAPPPATSTGLSPARSSPCRRGRRSPAGGKVTRADTSAWLLLVPVELAVPTWLTVLRRLTAAALTAAALAGACWGAFTSLYRTAAVARFPRGRVCAPGTLEGWRSLGRRHGEADLLFEDGRGVRHGSLPSSAAGPWPADRPRCLRPRPAPGRLPRKEAKP